MTIALIYTFIGIATFLASLTIEPGGNPLVDCASSAIVGAIWPLFLTVKLIRKIFD